MSHNVYLGIQSILDTNENIYAYELLFRSPGADTARFLYDLQATSRVLVNTLNTIGIDSLLGDKLGFINVDSEMLYEDIIDLLPANKFMLEILEFTHVDQNFIERIKELKEHGYQFSIDDVILNESMLTNFEPLFPYIDVIKIEVINMDEAEITHLVKRIAPYKNVKLLAEKVETRELFVLCKMLGFEFFQGYYFSKPRIINKKCIEPAKITLTKIISHIYSGSPPEVIECIFKEAPALTTSLLRYMNSAAMNFSTQVTSIKHAITLIGSKKLMQWVILIAYASDGKDPKGDPLLYLVQQRSKTMELLARQSSIKINPDEAFMTGLLSLMDILYGMEMSDVLTEMKLDERISQAILEQDGNIGKLLHLILALERESYQEVEDISLTFGLNSEIVNSARVDAVKWAMESLPQFNKVSA